MAVTEQYQPKMHDSQTKDVSKVPTPYTSHVITAHSMDDKPTIIIGMGPILIIIIGPIDLSIK